MTHDEIMFTLRNIFIEHSGLNMSNNGHFNDEYDLKEELGKGAFSIVRRCVKVRPETTDQIMIE